MGDPSGTTRHGSLPALHLDSVMWQRAGLITLAAGLVVVIDLKLKFPPVILFAVARGLTRLFCGLGPGVLSITFGALTSDFSVQPRYEFSLNNATAGLWFAYAACAAF